MDKAGCLDTTWLAGMFSDITQPAPITELSPTVTPLRIVTSLPTQTLRPMVIGAVV